MRHAVGQQSQRQAFPTAHYAQLAFGPAAEYMILNLYLLWGRSSGQSSDFACFLGLMLTASLIAKRARSRRARQLFRSAFLLGLYRWHSSDVSGNWCGFCGDSRK